MQESIAAPSIQPTQTPDAKILSDLATVIEKINLCTSMLQPLTSPSQIDQNESLLTIIGFLEACVPRVRELVEAGMTGALAEDTVVKCLTVNDSLCQVLELVEHPEKCEAVPAGAAAAVAVAKKPDADFDAFGIDDDYDIFGDEDDAEKKPAPVAAPAASVDADVDVATSALDELLLTPADVPVPVPAPAAATNTASASASAPETDEFDDFFGERMSNNKTFE